MNNEETAVIGSVEEPVGGGWEEPGDDQSDARGEGSVITTKQVFAAGVAATTAIVGANALFSSPSDEAATKGTESHAVVDAPTTTSTVQIPADAVEKYRGTQKATHATPSAPQATLNKPRLAIEGKALKAPPAPKPSQMVADSGSVPKPKFTPPSGAVTDRLVWGDTLSAEARENHTTVDQLVEWNKGNYPAVKTRDLILAGYDIVVGIQNPNQPATGEVSASAAPAATEGMPGQEVPAPQPEAPVTVPTSASGATNRTDLVVSTEPSNLTPNPTPPATPPATAPVAESTPPPPMSEIFNVPAIPDQFHQFGGAQIRNDIKYVMDVHNLAPNSASQLSSTFVRRSDNDHTVRQPNGDYGLIGANADMQVGMGTESREAQIDLIIRRFQEKDPALYNELTDRNTTQERARQIIDHLINHPDSDGKAFQLGQEIAWYLHADKNKPLQPPFSLEPMWIPSIEFNFDAIPEDYFRAGMGKQIRADLYSMMDELVAPDGKVISPNGAAAMSATFLAEANNDHRAYNPGEHAVGLIQARGKRNDGMPMDDRNAQIRFIFEQLWNDYPTVWKVLSDPNAKPEQIDSAMHDFIDYGVAGNRKQWARELAYFLHLPKGQIAPQSTQVVKPATIKATSVSSPEPQVQPQAGQAEVLPTPVLSNGQVVLAEHTFTVLGATTNFEVTAPAPSAPDKLGYVQMPDDPEGRYVFDGFAEPADRWGKPELVSVAQQVSIAFNSLYPQMQTHFGDLNERQKGVHVSHRTGIDIDLDAKGPAGAVFDMTNEHEYNQQATIDYGKIIFRTGMVDIIFFNDPVVRRELNTFAKENNLPGKVEYWRGHGNHAHLRIAVAPGPRVR